MAPGEAANCTLQSQARAPSIGKTSFATIRTKVDRKRLREAHCHVTARPATPAQIKCSAVWNSRLPDRTRALSADRTRPIWEVVRHGRLTALQACRRKRRCEGLPVRSFRQTRLEGQPTPHGRRPCSMCPTGVHQHDPPNTEPSPGYRGRLAQPYPQGVPMRRSRLNGVLRTPPASPRDAPERRWLCAFHVRRPHQRRKRIPPRRALVLAPANERDWSCASQQKWLSPSSLSISPCQKPKGRAVTYCHRQESACQSTSCVTRRRQPGTSTRIVPSTPPPHGMALLGSKVATASPLPVFEARFAASR